MSLLLVTLYCIAIVIAILYQLSSLISGHPSVVACTIGKRVATSTCFQRRFACNYWPLTNPSMPA